VEKNQDGLKSIFGEKREAEGGMKPIFQQNLFSWKILALRNVGKVAIAVVALDPKRLKELALALPRALSQ